MKKAFKQANKSYHTFRRPDLDLKSKSMNHRPMIGHRSDSGL